MMDIEPQRLSDRSVDGDPVDHDPVVSDPFVEDNRRVLAQGIRLIAGLDAHGYAGLHNAGASVGAHFRHVLDHYLCLREGLSSGVIDYDARRLRGRGCRAHLAR